MVRPTPGGRKAIEIWRTLEGLIENRWRERFGEDVIDTLQETLITIVGRIEVELPHGLPILGYGLFSIVPEHRDRSLGTAVPAIAALPLASLLSKALLWFAIEFERDSEVSLAICASVLRLLTEEGVQVRDLPRLASVSKEAIAMSLSFLVKRGYAAIKSETTASRSRVLVLTAKGRSAKDKYRQLVWAIEERWKSRFGEEAVFRLRELLERLEPTAQRSPLLRGLEPYPDGWRASIPKLEGLPHYPMVLHRGGFPDGS
jgi:DNA-binding MarR family transcriptional regulator